MPFDNVIPFSEYYNPNISLHDRFEALRDQGRFPDHQATGINEAILGYCIKFLADYLEIECSDVNKLQKEIEDKALRLIHEGGREVLSATLTGQVSGNSDALALQCLVDIHSTAALVKEIMFMKGFGRFDEDRFTSVDLGSGSGVLMPPSKIAGERNGFSSTFTYGVESQSQAVDRSTKVLEKLDDQHFRVIQNDVRSPNLYHQFGTPQLWVSETLGYHTPAFSIRRNGVMLQENDVQAKIDSIVSGGLDPILDIMHNIGIRFFAHLQSGEMVVFPNMMNGNFKPDHDKSTLLLKTGSGKHETLSEIGREFRAFEGITNTTARWAPVETSKEVQDAVIEMIRSLMENQKR